MSERTSEKSLEEFKEFYRNLRTEYLKDFIESTKRQFRRKYGRYQGVFGSMSPHSPSDEELEDIRHKVAAEKVLEERA